MALIQSQPQFITITLSILQSFFGWISQEINISLCIVQVLADFLPCTSRVGKDNEKERERKFIGEVTNLETQNVRLSTTPICS